MNSSITITNATNGAIVTITKFHQHSALHDPKFIFLAVLSVALIGTGLYLLFQKEKSK